MLMPFVANNYLALALMGLALFGNQWVAATYILDNGGSVACWAWWTNNYAGGLVSPTIDYRPEGTSAIAFVLKGRARVDLPGGSVSYSVL